MFEYQKKAILEVQIAFYKLLSKRIERMVLVAADILQKSSGKEHFHGALSGTLCQSEQALNIAAAHEGIGLEIFTHDLLNLLVGDVGRVGFFGGALKAPALAVDDEAFVGREDNTLDGHALSAHFCRVVYFGRGERKGERTETVETHTEAIGEIFADHLFDGRHSGIEVCRAKGASSRNRLHDFLEGHSSFSDHSRVVALRSIGIRVRVSVKFEWNSHDSFLTYGTG